MPPIEGSHERPAPYPPPDEEFRQHLYVQVWTGAFLRLGGCRRRNPEAEPAGRSSVESSDGAFGSSLAFDFEPEDCGNADGGPSHTH